MTTRRVLGLRGWLVSRSIVTGIFMVGCATATNTPAQDEAQRRWEACQSQVHGVDIRAVQLDGRIMFWSNGTYDGRSMLDCLARAGKNGPALPEAIYEMRPRGG